MADAVSIALTYGISAYDASDVALAQQVGTTLLTLDQRLVRALATSSYDICLFNDFEVHRYLECGKCPPDERYVCHSSKLRIQVINHTIPAA